MFPDDIVSPIPLGAGEFFEQGTESLSRYTLAAYLLLAGVLFVQPEDGEPRELGIIPPEDALGVLGISTLDGDRLPRNQLDLRQLADGAIAGVSRQELADDAVSVNLSQNPILAAQMVARGCAADDELIRVCALGSAFDFFDFDTIDIGQQIDWFIRNAEVLETFELLATLLARVFPIPAIGYATGQATPQNTTSSGLLAVHGTVLPFPQGNRPEWSVPPSGSLFTHLKTFRGDIYSSQDYYRWEGGYTDYAREVAIANLRDWIDSRGLNGIDIVAHSHGCNVVLGSTSIGARYRKIVLLSCPVHWKKYNLAQSMITNDVVSIRTIFDLVILMDRGAQRFPPQTINEVILPFWFTSHSATVKPANWQSQNLDKYLK